MLSHHRDSSSTRPSRSGASKRCGRRGGTHRSEETLAECVRTQTRFQRRFSSGVTVLVNYTYGHALGNASNANLGAQNNDWFRWIAHPEWEHANLDFDVRHRFVANYIWEVPVGHGKHFGGNMPSGLNYVVGNWQISGITTLSSGTWYTVTDANGNFANSDGQQRPDAVMGQSANGKPCVAGTFFNTCAFVDPALGSFGNVGQNTVRGPGVQNWDLSLLKEIPFAEQRRLQFRAEFFNIANHANFLFARTGTIQPCSARRPSAM